MARWKALAATAALMVAAGLVVNGSASADGVSVGQGPVCGRQWASVHVPNATYFNVYNADEAQTYTCLKVPWEKKPEFKIEADEPSEPWGYPNISSGWEWGRYSCAGHSGACYYYPVQIGEVMAGYAPRTTIRAHLTKGTYNLSYDIWLNKTAATPGQDNGAEVMIWLEWPGLDQPKTHPTRYVEIDGVRWGVFTHVAFHNGESWNYVAYYAMRPQDSAGLRLNPFFEDANRHGQISKEWWLTAIDAGFELVHGGDGSTISEYSLTGLPSAGQ